MTYVSRPEAVDLPLSAAEATEAAVDSPLSAAVVAESPTEEAVVDDVSVAEAPKAEEHSAEEPADADAADAVKATVEAADADFMSTAHEFHDDDSVWDGGVDTDEAKATAELLGEASLACTTVQCYIGVKRQLEGDETEQKDEGQGQSDTVAEQLKEETQLKKDEHEAFTSAGSAEMPAGASKVL